MATIKVFVFVDGDGDYGIGTDAESARDHYTENVSNDVPMCSRTLEITLEVPEPQPIQLAATIPADSIGNVPVKMTITA